jgi:plasmid stabilization system protein ParE
MYGVMILEEAHEDLRNIVAYISSENPGAAETLGGERRSSDEPESLPYQVPESKTPRSLKLIHGDYLIYYRIQEQKRSSKSAFKHGAQIK